MHRRGRFGVSKQIKRFVGQRHELTLSQRKLAIQLLDQNRSQSEVAKTLACSQSQISRIAARRLDILALYDKCKDPDSIRRKSRPRNTGLTPEIKSFRQKFAVNKNIFTHKKDRALNKKDLNDVISRIAHLSNNSSSNCNCEISETKEKVNVMEDMCSSTNDALRPSDEKVARCTDVDNAESSDVIDDDFRVPDSIESTDSLNSDSQNNYSEDQFISDFAHDTSNMRPRRGKALTLVHKKLIIEMLEAKKSQTEIARLFGKSQSVVSRMAAKKDRILDQWNNIKGSDHARLLREKDQCEMLLCPKKSTAKMSTVGIISEEEEATSSSDIYHKRQALSLSQKMEIIGMLNQRSSQREIAKLYGKSQAVISRIAGRKDIILSEWEKQNRIKSHLSALYPDVTAVTESGVSIYDSSSDLSASEMHESEDNYVTENVLTERYDLNDERLEPDNGSNSQPDLSQDVPFEEITENSAIRPSDVDIPEQNTAGEMRNWYRLSGEETGREVDSCARLAFPDHDRDIHNYGIRNKRALYSVPSINRRKRYRGLLLSERKLAIKLLEENKSQTEIARILGCSQSQISRIQAKKNSILNMSEDCPAGNVQTEDILRYHNPEQPEYGCSSEGLDVITKQKCCDSVLYSSISNTALVKPSSTCSEFDSAGDEANSDRNDYLLEAKDSSANLEENMSGKFEAVESDPVPSAADALNGLRTIRRYMQFSGIQNFQFFNSLESQLFCHISKLLR